MKTLQEYLTESLNEARKETFYNLGSTADGDKIMSISDEKGNLLEFDEKWLEGVIKKCKGWGNKEFIETVFTEMPDADQIGIEYSRDDEEPEPYCYAQRGEEDKLFQDC